MEYRPYENHLASAYDRGAAQYRTDDEIEARTPNHERLGGMLRRMCRAFPRPIRVLEIGCGTGRYFHWLENVQRLVGTDLSAEMLKQAEHPLRADEVTAREIQLLRGSVYEMEFPAESFDFIYSLGVFGYGAVWNQALADKIHRWLSPGGRLFFNAVEVPHSRTRMERMKKMTKARVYPYLPKALQRRLDARETVPLRIHARGEVETIMARAGFCDVELTSYACESSLWNGVHLECVARKRATASVPAREAAAEGMAVAAGA